MLSVGFQLEPFSATQSQEMRTQPIVELFSPRKVDQIASVNAPIKYSSTHYLANSSRLINFKCEWTLKEISHFQINRNIEHV